MHWFDAVTIVLTLVLVGVELSVSLFINPVTLNLPQAPQQQALSLFASRLGRAMPFWYGACGLALCAQAGLRRGTPDFRYALAAALLWLIVIAVTITVLVPINDRIANGTATDFAGDLRRWDSWHRARIAAIFTAALVIYTCPFADRSACRQAVTLRRQPASDAQEISPWASDWQW